MPNTRTLIAQAYSAFNHRDIDSALALMSANVSWPKASEGGRVVGKEEIRSYWTRQWKEFDPHVEPLEVIDQEGGVTDVRVHQLVKSISGDVLSDSEVWHVYTFANGLIERMDLMESETSPDAPTPSTAFSENDRAHRAERSCAGRFSGPCDRVTGVGRAHHHGHGRCAGDRRDRGAYRRTQWRCFAARSCRRRASGTILHL